MADGGERAHAGADAGLAREFEAERRRLTGVAYRMLGTIAEAEDVVQDAWLRLARVDRATIEDLPAWLTTVVSRLCLDHLRTARVARERYVGPWLPEPVVSDPRVPVDPATVIEVDDSIRLALLVMLEELTPEQRVAFVLHDVFAVPFAEVARVLDVSAAAARQLASRGRRAARAAGPVDRAGHDRHPGVLDAFRRAVVTGDLHALLAVLAPDAVWRSDGGGAVPAALRPVVGADKVARLILGLVAQAGPTLEMRDVLVNGEPGVLVSADVAPRLGARSLVVPHVGPDGLIHSFDVLRNPAKLGRIA